MVVKQNPLFVMGPFLPKTGSEGQVLAKNKLQSLDHKMLLMAVNAGWLPSAQNGVM